MKYFTATIIIVLSLMYLNSSAQTPLFANNISSGDYEGVKVCYDPSRKTISGVVAIRDGKHGCDGYFKGKMLGVNSAKFKVNIYSDVSENDTSSTSGQLSFFRIRRGSVLMRLDFGQDAPCLLLSVDGGAVFALEKSYPYSDFGIIKAPKAYAFSDSLLTHRKGYLVQGDYVSILSEKNDLCFVQYLPVQESAAKPNKPPFKAWIKKSNLIF